MNTKKIIDAKSVKGLAVGMFYYTSGSILGPLLVFGGLGYTLDKVFDTKPILLVIGVVLAFITTNVLLFKQIKRLNSTISSYKDKGEDNLNKEDKE